MGDRTNFQLRIASCPPEQADAVLEWIAELGLGDDWCPSWPYVGPKVLQLGLAYVANEVPCGSTSETIGRLADLPGVAFACWEDPYADWLGEVAYHVPSLEDPTWRSDCNASGSAVWTADQVDEVLGLDDQGRARHLGREHGDAISTLVDLNANVVVIPKVDPDEYDPVEHDYRCAECGTGAAHEYVVTILDHVDAKSTRTEVCRDCHGALAEPAAG